MIKHIFILTLCFFSITPLISGQTLLNKDQTTTYNKIPQEKIFVHYNATLLFSGDYLLYKIYNTNSQTKKLSHLSKIAYVELIGKDKNYIFRHKINLKYGIGQGDFFIPTSVPSGNYKLIAYTQWMRNAGDNFFFQGDICVINPFLENQNSINIKTTHSKLNKIYYSAKNKINKYINLEVNANQFAKRKKVILKVNALMNENSFGNYSVSVRKLDTIDVPNRPSADSFELTYPKAIKEKFFSDKNNIFLPELRGELLSGTVLEKETNKRMPFKNICLSISGKRPVFKSSLTNNSGTFYFNLDRPYESLNANLHVTDKDSEKYEIIVDQPTPLNYNNLIFSDFEIRPEMEDLILERSTNNQIENAYSSVKQNITRPVQHFPSFYSGQGITYNLDNYSRFKSVKETIVEIVNNVWIEKKKEKNTFRINSAGSSDYNLSTLIIVDGLLILNHDDVISYDARKIETISVINNRYKYGGNTFEGVISIETVNGDFKNNISEKYTKSISLIKPQDNKDYYNQKYEDGKSLNRVPDYRCQLYWEPNFELNKKESTLSFFTSDNVGDYEISIEGFTRDGTPISLKKIISVK